jgi:hypothetical protein
MPEFMDVHTAMKGVTPEALLEAHNADLAIQDDEHVNFKHAWADPESGMVFCLSEAPKRRGRPAHPRARRAPGRQRLPGPGPGLTHHPDTGWRTTPTAAAISCNPR